MAQQMKYYTVFLDGIDKTGKDTIRQYVWRLNKSLNVFCRGYISLEVYNRLYKRNVAYELPYENALYVLLTVNHNDWTIRCEMTDEPVIDFLQHSTEFQVVFEQLKMNGYKTMSFNTSEMTPYQIAEQIVAYIDELNKM